MRFVTDNNKFAQKEAEREYEIAEDYYEREEYELAVKYFMSSAKKGSAKSLNKLGICYATGLGIEQSYGKAMECYEGAAKKEYKGAIHNLGLCYYHGLGTRLDYDKAVSIFPKLRIWAMPSPNITLPAAIQTGRALKKTRKRPLSGTKKRQATGT